MVKLLCMFRKSSKLITTFMIIIALFGSFMIASAEMGNAAGQTDVLTSSILKQIAIVALGGICYIICMNIKPFSLPQSLYRIAYFGVCILLFIPRAFPPINGAYAWIRIASFSIQPSEFVKPFIILLGAKLIGLDRREKNMSYVRQYILSVLILVGIIVFVQKDTGTAIVILGITYCICLITCHKGMAKFHNALMIILIIGAISCLILLSPPVTKLLSNYTGNYQIARIVSSGNPFNDQYNTGYHLVMSLVSFATGGWLGLGYGQSIHKYMNFPNPSTDFILPVIVEETGILGFAIICILYLGIMISLSFYSFKAKTVRSKIVFFGTFIYFFIHFLFNVGGVSGLIPLTGVPLLMLSSGGSSTLASMICLGLCQSEIININSKDESNSREV